MLSPVRRSSEMYSKQGELSWLPLQPLYLAEWPILTPTNISALETFVTMRYINLHLPLPLPSVMRDPSHQLAQSTIIYCPYQKTSFPLHECQLVQCQMPVDEAR